MPLKEHLAFGERLREERVLLKLTQQDLASAMGVSKGSQVNYEAGTRPFDVHYLAKAHDAGVDIVHVITGKSLAQVAVENFDWAQHDFVLQSIESWLLEANLELPLDSKMSLLRRIMRINARKKRDGSDIMEMLRNAA